MSSRREPQPLSLDDVMDWYEAVRESILVHRGAVLTMLHGGDLGAPSRFYAMSRIEIEDDFNDCLSELESTAVMTLVASAEAKLRADYLERIEHNFKDPVSKCYLTYHKTLSPDNQRRGRVPLDEGILEALKQAAVMANHYIGDFRDVLNLRHWLAHGRYWTVNLGRNFYHPEDVYQIAHTLLTALPP